jgi:ribosomal protein S18 acetylase RimI-like enzyme
VSEPAGAQTAWPLRRARPHEYEAAGELTVAAYRLGEVDGDDSYAEVLRDAARRAEQAELYVVADDVEGLVATVTLAPAGTEWAEIAHDGELEVRMLAVTPAAWGRRIATQIMEQVIALAEERRFTHIVLLVIEDNEAAHRLYQRLGFTRIPERDWRPWPELLLMAYQLPLGQ